MVFVFANLAESLQLLHGVNGIFYGILTFKMCAESRKKSKLRTFPNGSFMLTKVLRKPRDGDGKKKL